MGATSVTGVGTGDAFPGIKGPGNNRNAFVPLAGAHVVAAGITLMRDNTWKIDVLLPEPLKYGIDSYAVLVTPQISTGTGELNHQSGFESQDRYYDYDVGSNFRVRVNKLDNRWIFDSSFGTNGSWYYSTNKGTSDDPVDGSISLPPGGMIGFTVHIGTDNNQNPRPSLMWTIVYTGSGSEV
jgi:hypothetical protein